jgi:hypothetical protein
MVEMMSVKPFVALCAVVALLAAVLPVAAQTPPPAHPRIEVTPRALPPVHRRCASWYVVQYRPSGTVLFPEKHCWWERG